jgi:phage baseplate assembly protein V
MYDAEQAHVLRGLISRGVVRATNDRGGAQSVDATLARHVDRSDIEVIQPFGFASNPGPGGQAIFLAIGGDQGDLMALPVANRSQRLGNVKHGESAIYAADGSRVHAKQGGKIDVLARNEALIKVGDLAIEIQRGGDLVRISKGGAAGARLVVRPGYVKMHSGAHYVVAHGGGITVSQTPVVGADPQPGV